MLSVSKASAGEIVIGGLITPLALHFGYDLDGMEQGRGPNRLDYEVCTNMKMIERHGEQYILKFKANPHFYIPLPNPRYVSVRTRSTWTYDLTAPPPPPYDAEAPDEQDQEEFLALPPVELEMPDARMPDFSEPGPSGTTSGGATLNSIYDLLSSMDARQRRVEMLCDNMYAWHLSQNHDLPPPPPPCL